DRADGGALSEAGTGIPDQVAVGARVRAERRIAREADLDPVRGRALLILGTDLIAADGGLRGNLAGLEQRTAAVRRRQIRYARRRGWGSGKRSAATTLVRVVRRRPDEPGGDVARRERLADLIRAVVDRTLALDVACLIAVRARCRHAARVGR